jgi:hypothetical protein
MPALGEAGRSVRRLFRAAADPELVSIARPLARDAAATRNLTPALRNSLKNPAEAEKLAQNAEQGAADAKALKDKEPAGTEAGTAAERAAKAERWGLSGPNGKYYQAGLVGIPIVTVLAIAGARYDQTNGKTANITNIERVDSSRIKVSFDKPTEMFSPARGDTVEFHSTPCTPDINSGSKSVVSVGDTDNSIIVSVGIQQAGKAPWGSFTCHTSFGNQVAGTFTSALRWAGSIAGDVLNVGENVLCGAVPQLCEILPGLANIGQILMWVCIGVCALIIIGLIIGIIYKLKK